MPCLSIVRSCFLVGSSRRLDWVGGPCRVRSPGASFRYHWGQLRQDDHYPWYHYYLCLLVARCYRYVVPPTTCLSGLLNFHEKPLTHLPSKPLFGYLTACSTPLIALLVAGAVQVVPYWDMDIMGYHNISYLINASIYLVKGGRLGLLPGVLFQSCRPSFRHTGVMFLDFAFLTRLGYNGNPLTVHFE